MAGVTQNNLCMQLQADILQTEVSRPVVAETTALGAAYAAGLAIGVWKNTHELLTQWQESHRWVPAVSHEERQRGITKLEQGNRANPQLEITWAPALGKEVKNRGALKPASLNAFVIAASQRLT